MQTLLPPNGVYCGHANCSICILYIPIDANANALAASKQEKYLKAVHVIAGGFNHANVKTVLPNSHQLLWNVWPDE